MANLLFVTVAAPGAGKDYFINNSSLRGYSLSADDLRLYHQSPIMEVNGEYKISARNDKAVWELLFNLLEKRCQSGETTIINATHSKSSDFAKYKKIIEEYRYRAYAIDMRNIPIETAKKQNKQRPEYKQVSEEIIDNIYSRFVHHEIPGYFTTIKSEEVENILNYKPLDFNKWEKIVVFGDVHSCWEPIKQYFELNPENDKFYYIFLGDLFDRGIQTKEVLKFIVEHYNKSNFYFIRGNHDLSFHNYAYEKIEQIRSNEFLKNTMPEIQSSCYDLGVMRNICRKMGNFAYFTYGEKIWWMCHGGTPILPPKLGLFPFRQLIYGVGKYEDDIKIVENWNNKMPKDHFTAFGHRNISSLPIQSKRVFNLENNVEFGGNLRIIEITKDNINPIEIKNTIFKQTAPINIENQSQENIVEKLSDSAELIKIIESLRSNRDVYEDKQSNNISSFNFRKSVFWNKGYSKTKELNRGFFVNTYTNTFVAKGYEKFYNLYETQETRPEILREKLVFPINVYLKYNGFLGLLGLNDEKNEPVFCSKSKTNGEFSNLFKEIFIQNHGSNLGLITEELKNKNISLIFEALTPHDPHIIESLVDEIILLNISNRSLENRNYTYDEIVKFATQYNLKVKERCFILNNIADFNKFLIEWNNSDFTKYNNNYIEGFVLEDSNNFKVKLKTKYYKTHKFLRSIKDSVRARRQINLSALNTPYLNEFYAFLKKLDNKDLEKDIVFLKKKFDLINI